MTIGKLQILVVLLPIIFMIHDFEEIIMFRSWLDKNKNELDSRFPKISFFLEKRNYFKLSTSAFAIAVLEEFIIISLITVLSLAYNNYYIWFAIFQAYTIHIILHIIQWLIYGKYVPVIITSFLTLPYSIYTLWVLSYTFDISSIQIVIWTITGMFITILNFPLAFYCSFKFENWKNNYYK